MSVLKKLILGSNSPRRKELLQQMGYTFDVLVSHVDESFDDDMPCAMVAPYLSTVKFKALQENLDDNQWLITADSVVIFNDCIYNKPHDYTAAQDMLTQLSGQRHIVVTGVTLGTTIHFDTFSVTTEVLFAPLSAAEIDYYIRHYAPYDKAGAYGIQDWIGRNKIESIKGSYTNVMGLPTFELYNALIQRGIQPNILPKP